MPTDFWQNWLPAGQVRPVQSALTIPTFSVPNVPGLDETESSIIFARFSVDLPSYFTFIPVLEPPTSGFTLAVLSEGQRYKLWGNIGEVLNYPLYTGEPLAKTTLIEAWTVQKNTATLTNTAFNLALGKYTAQADYKTKSPTIYAVKTAEYYPFS